MSVLVEKACGNCKCYKGAKIRCGKSSYIPQRDTDSCGGRDFEPKLEKNCGSCKSFNGSNYCKKYNVSSMKPGYGSTCSGYALKSEEHEILFGTGERNLYYVNSPKKETSIMSNAIVRLADSQFNKEVTDFGGLQLDLKDALVKLQNEERQAAATAAAKEVLSVINDANEHIEFQVGQIQTFRRNIDTAKKDISEINKAKAYGLATNNFVPLAVRLGRVQEYSVTNKDLLKIDESKLPEGWDKKPESK